MIGKILILLLSLGLLLVGVFLFKNNLIILPQEPKSLPREHIVINDAQYPSFSLIYIANKEGFFKDQNLDVTIQSYVTGKDALAAVIRGNGDLATVYETPFVRQVYQGADIRAISSLHKSATSTALFTLQSKNIRTVSDLKNKRIGLIKGTNAEFFLYTLLTSNGLSNSDVTLLNLNPSEQSKAFENNTIDALITFNPLLYQLKNKFKDEGKVIDSDLYTENSLLVGTTHTINSRKDVMKRIIIALDRAQQFSKQNRRTSIEDVHSSIQNASLNDIQGVWDDYKLTLQLDNVLLSLMNREGQWLKIINAYPTRDLPNFRDSIDTEFLQDVNPDYVTLY